MHIERISLKNIDQLIVDYKHHNEKTMKYFAYKPFATETDQERLRELKTRTFQREKLVDLLIEQNRAWDCTEEVITNIERLRQDDSVVVIGGQQAGLLTGPMYTVNKVISIIKLAHEKEQTLGIPVIPVFWIAGEDHDYDEINHTYILKNEPLKHTIDHLMANKKAVSSIKKDQNKLDSFIRGVFEELEDTSFTKPLFSKIDEMAQKAENYVDFFAYFIHYLFSKYGVVLIDSANENLRQFESDYFVQMIQNQESLSEKVFNTKNALAQDGYSINLDVARDDSHIFYTHNEERLLLSVNDDFWFDRDEIVSFTTDEMLEIAKNSPEKLSNNVVSRPIMQEFIFPTLAFVGGNGEISYWSTLKEAFEVFGLTMPPVLPRYSFTYIDSNLQKSLDRTNLTIEEVFNDDLLSRKMNWLRNQTAPSISLLFEQLIESIEKGHEPIQHLAADIQGDVAQLADKNLERIKDELSFLENRLERALAEKYSHMLKHYDYIEHTVLPFNVLQERIWSPIYWLNEHGVNFIHQLIDSELDIKNDHYIVSF